MTIFEFIASLISLIGIWLTVKRKTICWLFNIIGTVMYLYIFYDTKLYSDSSLQIIFIIFQIYGWIEWTRKNDSIENEPTFVIKRLDLKSYLILTPIFLITTFLIGTFLKRQTDAAMPFVDTALSALSIIGSYLQAKKYIENWHLWIIANFCYIFMFLYKGLYPTSALYLVFMILALAGLIEWRNFRKKVS